MANRLFNDKYCVLAASITYANGDCLGERSVQQNVKIKVCEIHSNDR